MNRHFEDARYYLKRAAENAKQGVRTELEPVEQWLREKTGREIEPEPGRVEKARMQLRDAQAAVEAEVGEAVDEARRKLHAFRGT